MAFPNVTLPLKVAISVVAVGIALMRFTRRIWRYF